MDRDTFNAFCATLPAAHHVVQWGGADVWKVGEKVFAICGWTDGDIPGITFKTSDFDYEMLRDMPGLRPAPYLASRGMKWIQRFDQPSLEDEALKDQITESHRLAALNLSKKRRAALGLDF